MFCQMAQKPGSDIPSIDPLISPSFVVEVSDFPIESGEFGYNSRVGDGVVDFVDSCSEFLTHLRVEVVDGDVVPCALDAGEWGLRRARELGLVV